MEEASVPVPASSQSSSGLRLMGSGDGDDDVARERGVASFSTQANALLRKNLTFQKRNIKTNTCIVAYPFIVCVLLLIMKTLINNEFDNPKYQCGCMCIPVNGTGTCQKVCGPQYSTLDQVANCPIANPPEWPALMQVPLPEFHAARDVYLPFADLTDSSCRLSDSCPATVLFTGQNQTLAQTLAGSLFPAMDGSSPNFSDYLTVFSQVVPGSDTYTRDTQYIEPAFISDRPLYYIQPSCLSSSSTKATINYQGVSFTIDVVCIQGLLLWRSASSIINDELFRGYRQSNTERKLNEFLTAYDFLDTDEKGYNLDIWYNSTYSNNSAYVEIAIQRVPRSLNTASNAFLKFLKGAGVTMEFEFVKETPKPGTKNRFDISSILGPLFFTWIVQLLLPVILTYLVYEKQQKLKIMMKMHGLTDGPYWLISYFYFLLLSAAYMICFVIFGSLIGLELFRLNDYSIQVVFYFIYINLQIALAFLVATFFSTVKTATVIGYIYVFGTGLLGQFLLKFFVEDSSFSKGWIIVMELVPGFSLYRGLYEFGEYASSGSSTGTNGMRWGDLSSSENGIRNAMIIMVLEWMVLLPLAFYIDQVSSLGGSIRKDPLFFLKFLKKKKKMSRLPSLQLTNSFNRQGVVIDVNNKHDVTQERELVEKLVMEENINNYAVISDNLRKVYPGRDGNPDKLAVEGLSLALPQGECFGMLGPNGAGKTSFIHMMIGLIKSTSGTAYVQGMDIRTDMDGIYTNMGVCPQHDLLWENLTGREHLLFYGRLKNLKGDALMQAVEESLKSVNLFYGGVGDKQSKTYSGGMKRRLSVAISFIGDPKVVYMDEPSTGLDPASRNNLWNVVKRAKKDRAIILTTHSMEEAEVLCDRLGIFVDGSFQCLGNPKELKARYGGSYVFTMTTSAEKEQEVETLVQHLSPNANKIYHISGTQKFEIPKQEVRISDVFQAVEKAKSRFTIYAWGLADTTLEDVFIKVAKGAQAFNVLS
ncbi:ABC transporter A family member 7-like protein [Carex littledalei]|uniref:ABC transporter A family member 7-like protein n=1 Tax=Carex littledalei TaxID=544730 RepID=A0A833UYH5_9POAL|nr:ABC transporter A family member 7-like protein [Carex littledalei]